MRKTGRWKKGKGKSKENMADGAIDGDRQTKQWNKEDGEKFKRHRERDDRKYRMGGG